MAVESGTVPGAERVGEAEPDAIERYLREEHALRARRARRFAAVFGIGAVACGAMVTQMSDIGHAVGFGGLALALLAGGAIMLRAGRTR